MSKIRQSARGETCTFQIPGVCNHDPETVVLCHAPHPDKGTGIKGPDTWAAYGCSACHDMIDGRTQIAWSGGEPPITHLGEHASQVTILRDIWFGNTDSIWYWAIRETQRRLIAKGLMPK